MQVWTTASGNTAVIASGKPPSTARRAGAQDRLEAVNDSQHDIINAPVLELVHDAQPELGAFILLDPQAQNLLSAIGAGTQRDVDRLIPNHALIADLNADGVEEDERIGRIERALLPGRDLIQYRVCDRRYQVG